MAMMPRVFVSLLGSLFCATVVLAGPADVPVLFTNAPVTMVNTSVFVAGNIPQLGNWDPSRSIKMVVSNCVGQTCNWFVNIGIPEGTSYEYKFVQRQDNCGSCYSNPANATFEPPPNINRTGSTPAGSAAPYKGKTVFYYSGWSNVSLLYSNTVTGFANQPMIAIGPGRGGSEKIWRADGVNSAGETNLQFAFYTVVAGTNDYDNGGQPGVDYRTPLDACVVQDGQVYNYWPPPFVSTNRVVAFSIAPNNGLPQRTIRVYLPRGFNENTTKRYPVLYMHDGQNLFSGMAGLGGSWNADLNAANLIRFGKMRETIIVGVASDTGNRFCEYAPPGCPYSQCSTPTGDKYASFLADQLKPHIDNTYSITAGRTLTDAENTGVLGSSLGGLISAYIGWQRSDTFHKIGCMSSSFWVCFPIPSPDSKRPIRIYLDSGDKDGQTSVGSSDSLLDTMGERDNLIKNGYVFNMDLDHMIGYGHWHSEVWWNPRLPRVFTYLFPTSDEPDTVLDTAAPPRITNYQLAGDSNVLTWTSYRLRTYTVQGITNESLPSSVTWSNLFTTPVPEPRFWSYPSLGVTNSFHFLRVRENAVPNWPN
jgi:predicted alpha/beta superfamily hydrolase